MITRATINRLLASFLSLCSCSLVHPSLTTDDLSQLKQLDVPQLTCRQTDQKTLTISLGVPIAHTGNRQQEVLLLAKHGLTNHIEHCHINSRGMRLNISRVIKGQGAGLYGDWAVALLDRSLGDDITRLKPVIVPRQAIAQFAAKGGTIQVPRAHPDLANACTVFTPTEALHDTTDQNQILLATCPMPAGKSGAPAIANINQQPGLIGLALGYRFATAPNPTGPTSGSVIRLVDQEIVEAINKLTTHDE